MPWPIQARFLHKTVGLGEPADGAKKHTSNGLHPKSDGRDGLQPNSDGLHPNNAPTDGRSCSGSMLSKIHGYQATAVPQRQGDPRCPPFAPLRSPQGAVRRRTRCVDVAHVDTGRPRVGVSSELAALFGGCRLLGGCGVGRMDIRR